MPRTLLYIFCYVAAVFLGYAAIAHGEAPRPKGYMRVKPMPAGPPAPFAPRAAVRAAGVTPLPLWTYAERAHASLGGQMYSGMMVGTSPLSHAKTTTTIQVQIIPLIVTINDVNGTIIYDPTAADPCLPGANATDLSVIMNSPVFQNTPWTMNGIDLGTTQYFDAHRRAEFWALVGGSDYHILLNATVLPAQSLTFGTGVGSTGPGSNNSAASFSGNHCGNIGVVQTADLDAAIQTMINAGPLTGAVNAGTFPIFLTSNVVSADSGTNINQSCCTLGYHGSYSAGSNMQIYAPFEIDSSGVFGGGDVTTLAHEIAEALDNPTGNNLTPMWGNEGQAVGQGQNNLEVGDPLTPGNGTPSKSFIVTGSNGFVYHLQELAFFSWYFGNRSLGAGGKFSNNGSFKGPCILFPPGGSN